MHHANNRVIGILFDHLLCKEYKKSHSRLVFSPVCQEKKAMYRYDRSHDWEEQKNCTFAQVKNIRMTPFLQQIATLFYETYGTVPRGVVKGGAGAGPRGRSRSGVISGRGRPSVDRKSVV